MLEKSLRTIERLIPKRIYRSLQPAYHFLLSFTGAVRYCFASRHLTVILVTGTKGKTSTTEILNNILEESGARTAVMGTLRFKIGDKSVRNLRKMTIPGRFFVQKFLREAVDARCTHAILEMTSEGAKQFRQRFIEMDMLIFTNLAPEHIESHGSYEAYRDAKLSIGRTLSRSNKAKRYMVANSDDKEAHYFLELPNIIPVPFTLADAGDIDSTENGTILAWRGKVAHSALPGIFNAYNILAAATAAQSLDIPDDVIVRGIEKTVQIEGRMERILEGQHFPVIVDYAHTPDSLRAVYETYKDHDKICVLGNTGGGRDTWKRPVMGSIAEEFCKEIILTNEDPYDENPEEILKAMTLGMKSKKPHLILDRRDAIDYALKLANGSKNSAVLITGKGTDPFIMEAHGKKTPWDDRDVARKALREMLSSH